MASEREVSSWASLVLLVTSPFKMPLKRSSQQDTSLEGLDMHKKMKKVNPGAGTFFFRLKCHFTCLDFFIGVTDTQTTRRSSRPTKGSGGQLAQLQRIERIQMEQAAMTKVSHAAQLDVSTANEPVNPMAPTKLKPRIKSSARAQQSGQSGMVCSTRIFIRLLTEHDASPYKSL